MKQRVPMPVSYQDRNFSSYVDRDVVLFGAGLFVQPAIHSLDQRGIIPACICDNSTAKHGTIIMDVPVTSPAEARIAFPNAIVIITTHSIYFEEIRLQLTEMGWKDILNCAYLLASFEYDRNSFASGLSMLHFDLDRFFYNFFLKYFPDKLIIPSLDIVITEKCSLKCRDCSNLMQYYTHPQDADYDKLFNSLDVIMQSVDHVLELRVLGGETFMNRSAFQYIERLRQYNNYSRIAVYSNGTIVPGEDTLYCLTHDDTYLRISDYGQVSRKLTEMLKLFDAHGVVYDVLKCEKWQDCASISKRERTINELEAVYSCCCANKTLTLLNGSLYICPFAANASNLGALQPFPHESLKVDNCISARGIRERLFNMLRMKTYFTACEYCAGRPDYETPLPAAIQTPAPLPYSRIYKEGA